MLRMHSQSSQSTNVNKSLPSNNGGREYILIDLTSSVRDFIRHVDDEVDDLGYSVEGVLQMYSSVKYPPTRAPNALSHMAEVLMHEGIADSFEDALIIGDYTINILFPAITSAILKLGFHGGEIVNGKVSLTGRNRKIYCSVLMMVV